MNYQQFITIVNQKVNCLLHKDTISQVHLAIKNNGTERSGLTISQKGTNISPTIYLEEYFRHYQNGMLIDEIVESILSLYNEVKFDHDWDVNQIRNFSDIKHSLAFKLIHFEKNKNLLQNIPHVPYLDLAIVFYLLLESTEKGAATILITNEMLTHWNISLENLHQASLLNTPKLLQAEFKPMYQVIHELMGETSYDRDTAEDSSMYVLSNQYRHFGAGCILYDRVLEDIGNLINEDFFILPSSIHETIILPVSCEMSKESLSEMVVEINETQVSEEDVLSDHAYYFCRKHNKIIY